MITVLSVAYPLAQVGPECLGGAEQILTALDRALVEHGHRSIVIAQAGSRSAGELIEIATGKSVLDGAAIKEARLLAKSAVDVTLRRHRIDLIHMHGIDFDSYLPAAGPPVLATLHCPRDWYSCAALHPARPRTWLNPVSEHQRRTILPNERVLDAIENGVEIAPIEPSRAGNFVLTLSRIAPEKGIDIAMRAAKRAGVPLLVAGKVFPYPAHLEYIEKAIVPLVDFNRRLIGVVSGERKQELLASARCVLIPSRVAETSSLTAREALAAGTPVVAFNTGALRDVVEHGVTGYLVSDEREMADAILAAADLDREKCRGAAMSRFSLESMNRAYLDLYASLIARSV